MTRGCTLVLILLVANFRLSAATYEQEVMADNPFVYYRFDEANGDTANDSSGNDHHGEYLDVELGEKSAGDALGTAARFDGEVSLVDVPNLDFESDQFSIEVWLNMDFIIGGCCTSVFSPNGWEPGWVHYNLGEPGRVEFALNSGGPNDRWTENDALPLEEWAHVVSTYDADEALARIWINGEEFDYAPAEFNTPLPVEVVVESQIGAWQGSRFLAGAMDEFAIYSTALTEDRVLAHYNAGLGLNTLSGDFDSSGALDVADINMLTGAVASGANDAAFDLTGDGIVDAADLTNWVVDLKNTWIGDANVDGEFNSGDLVSVFQKGKFEQDVDATWEEGDWSGDNRFSSTDFVVAFQDGGFERGKRAAVASVPEPTSVALIVLPFLMLIRRRLA